MKQALAALLLNHAVAGQGAPELEDWLPQVLSAVLELLGNTPVDDVETVYRCECCGCAGGMVVWCTQVCACGGYGCVVQHVDEAAGAGFGVAVGAAGQAGGGGAAGGGSCRGGDTGNAATAWLRKV